MSTPGGEPLVRDHRVLRTTRAVSIVIVPVLTAAFVILFLRPSLFQDDWPWRLTPLTARSLAAFAAFPAIAYLAFAFERRWSALRWPLETAIAGLALIAVGGVAPTGSSTRARERGCGGSASLSDWRS